MTSVSLLNEAVGFNGAFVSGSTLVDVLMSSNIDVETLQENPEMIINALRRTTIVRIFVFIGF